METLRVSDTGELLKAAVKRADHIRSELVQLREQAVVAAAAPAALGEATQRQLPSADREPASTLAMAQDEPLAGQQRKFRMLAVDSTTAHAGSRAAEQPPAASQPLPLHSGERSAALKSVRHVAQHSWSIPSAQQQLAAVLGPQRRQGGSERGAADPLALLSTDAAFAAQSGPCPGTESLDELIAALRAEQAGGDGTLGCLLAESRAGSPAAADQGGGSRVRGSSRGGRSTGPPRGQQRQGPPGEARRQLHQLLPTFDPTKAEKQLKAKLQQVNAAKRFNDARVRPPPLAAPRAASVPRLPLTSLSRSASGAAGPLGSARQAGQENAMLPLQGWPQQQHADTLRVPSSARLGSARLGPPLAGDGVRPSHAVAAQPASARGDRAAAGPDGGSLRFSGKQSRVSLVQLLCSPSSSCAAAEAPSQPDSVFSSAAFPCAATSAASAAARAAAPGAAQAAHGLKACGAGPQSAAPRAQAERPPHAQRINTVRLGPWQGPAGGTAPPAGPVVPPPLRYAPPGEWRLASAAGQAAAAPSRSPRVHPGGGGRRLARGLQSPPATPGASAAALQGSPPGSESSSSGASSSPGGLQQQPSGTGAGAGTGQPLPAGSSSSVGRKRSGSEVGLAGEEPASLKKRSPEVDGGRRSLARASGPEAGSSGAAAAAAIAAESQAAEACQALGGLSTAELAREAAPRGQAGQQPPLGSRAASAAPRPLPRPKKPTAVQPPPPGSQLVLPVVMMHSPPKHRQRPPPPQQQELQQQQLRQAGVGTDEGASALLPAQPQPLKAAGPAAAVKPPAGLAAGPGSTARRHQTEPPLPAQAPPAAQAPAAAQQLPAAAQQLPAQAQAPALAQVQRQADGGRSGRRGAAAVPRLALGGRGREEELPSQSSWVASPREAPLGELPSTTRLISSHRQPRVEARVASAAAPPAPPDQQAAGQRERAGSGAVPPTASVKLAAAAGQAGERPRACSSPSPSIPTPRRRVASLEPPEAAVRLRDDAYGKQLLAAAPQLADATGAALLDALGQGWLVRKAWVKPNFKAGGSTRRLQLAPGPGGRLQAAYPHGLLRQPLRVGVKRAVVNSPVWRLGAYLVLDTARGMLRLEPGSAAEYAQWVLALNAAFLASGESGARGGPGASVQQQPVGDMCWSAAILFG